MNIQIIKNQLETTFGDYCTKSDLIENRDEIPRLIIRTIEPFSRALASSIFTTGLLGYDAIVGLEYRRCFEYSITEDTCPSICAASDRIKEFIKTKVFADKIKDVILDETGKYGKVFSGLVEYIQNHPSSLLDLEDENAVRNFVRDKVSEKVNNCVDNMIGAEPGQKKKYIAQVDKLFKATQDVTLLKGFFLDWMIFDLVDKMFDVSIGALQQTVLKGEITEEAVDLVGSVCLKADETKISNEETITKEAADSMVDVFHEVDHWLSGSMQFET